MLGSSLPILLLAMQAQPRVAPAVPPPVVVVPRPSPEDEAKLRAVPHRIDLRVSAGRDILWEGPLHVSANEGAHINYSKREAVQPLCREDQNRYDGTQSGININLRSQGDRTAHRYHIDVSWNRSAEPRSCGTDGTRSVSVNQQILLPVGETVRVEGDGGLSIQLTRRD